MSEVATLLVSLIAILAAARFFTNGVEWLGRHLELGEGAVGSVLAAVGTAMPETLIPIVAILFVGGQHGSEIGIGALLGAPFMLSTLGFFITGAAALTFRRRRRTGSVVVINRRVLMRDLTHFLAFYLPAIGVSFAPRWIGLVVCGCLLAGYGRYLYVNLTEKATLETEGEPLSLHMLWSRMFFRREPGESRAAFHSRRRHHALHTTPELTAVVAQVVIALGGILVGAYVFVDAVREVSRSLGAPEMLVALLIAPFATELPEKFNSVIWMGQSKDTLALGNMTGAMVFQSSIPVTVGIVFTQWKFTHIQHGHAGLISVGIAVFSAIFVLLAVRSRDGDHNDRAHLSPWVLCIGLLFYIAFVISVIEHF
jgi:cation:H+ antiporter